MIKKVLIGGVTAAVLAGFFFGRDAFSYVGTTVGWVKDSVRDTVPMEFEIERARKMIRDLDPEIRQQMHVIAKEEVEVERLGREVASLQENLETQQAQIMRLKSDLQSDNNVFQYAGRSYSADQVRVDLANRFKRFKTKDATLASLQQISDARTQSLQAARDNLEGMRVAKRQLEVEIENIEAQRKMVLAANTTCQFSYDDSHLSRVKELVADLQTRLEVDRKLHEVEVEYQGQIPLSEPAPENILEEVTTYFAEPRESVAELSTIDLN